MIKVKNSKSLQSKVVTGKPVEKLPDINDLIKEIEELKQRVNKLENKK